MAETFEPVTLSDVKAAIGKLLPLDRLDAVAPGLAGNPARNTWAVVGMASAIFYMAERGRNPKVKSILDASLYCSTCLNVGYADIHPQTPVGKAIGTFLMTMGPALVTRVLDGPADAKREEVQAEMLSTLHRILGELEKQSGASGGEREQAAAGQAG